jgi:hypothetical protein
MSSINQILNSALMEAVELKETTGVAVLDDGKPNAKKYTELVKKEEDNELQREEQKAVSNHPADPNMVTPTDWTKYGKYGGAGLAALGAGLGAVALAKKLRSKKTAVTSAKAKK